MDILPLSSEGQFTILSYHLGGFVIRDNTGHRRDWHGSLLIKPDGVSPILAKNIAELNDAEVAPLLPLQLELLLIGTGARMILPSKTERDRWQRLVPSVEWMTSGAAARTYQMATAEQRRVAGLIIAL
ncbi:MAG: MTH938/NDUFAF3 family protein [Alphaproteobacteria bacterium]|nr:MTH938/NDUFAF3 family protein [Alphaproteobacteria bacterium]